MEVVSEFINKPYRVFALINTTDYDGDEDCGVKVVRVYNDEVYNETDIFGWDANDLFNLRVGDWRIAEGFDGAYAMRIA